MPIDPRVSNRNNCNEEFTKALTNIIRMAARPRRNPMECKKLGRVTSRSQKETLPKIGNMRRKDAAKDGGAAINDSVMSYKDSQETSTLAFVPVKCGYIMR
jgi:uncharacterized protein YgiB involved in biofilm formation